MIISISGKKGSGKDTLGRMLQYLTQDDASKEVTSWKLHLEEGSRLVEVYSPWEIKKWATSMRKIASQLTGLPIHYVESEDFKKSNLPSEWDVWEYQDSITGAMVVRPSLKQLEYFFSEHPFVDISAWHPTQRPMTGRMFLQWLGTDAMRDGLHPNVWINGLMREYKPTSLVEGTCVKMATNPENIAEQVWVIPEGHGEHSGKLIPNMYFRYNKETEEFPKWLITDTRFLNEIEVVKKHNGVTILITKEGLPEDNHKSEKSLESFAFDYTITNDGSLEDLLESAKFLKRKLKL